MTKRIKRGGRTHSGRARCRRVSGCYPKDLRRAIRRELPREGLPLLSEDGRVRWSARLLVTAALLMMWDAGRALQDRFLAARGSVVDMYPSRRRPGSSCEGFMAALRKRSASLLKTVAEFQRERVAALTRCWEVRGWAAFAVDGSKFDCPRTRANEKFFGRTGKNNSGPQIQATVVSHIGSGLPWTWERDALEDGERTHLRRMYDRLPAGALLVMDTGLGGYDLLGEIIASGRNVLVRVGSGTTLLRGLGHPAEGRQTVYMWPVANQSRHRDGSGPERPLMLRLIVRGRGKRKLHLLTNVLDGSRLSDSDAVALYRGRWGIELSYRALKQTLERRKMLCDSPAHALVELDWTIMSLWMLGLMTLRRLVAAREAPRRWSVAASLRAARAAMAPSDGRRRGASLQTRLRSALVDSYRRTRRKAARHWAAKRKQKPPGDPRSLMASARQIRIAQVIFLQQTHKSLAA
jgi:hypothetical protein